MTKEGLKQGNGEGIQASRKVVNLSYVRQQRSERQINSTSLRWNQTAHTASLIRDVTPHHPEFVMKTAFYVRNVMGLRTPGNRNDCRVRAHTLR